MAIDWQHEEIKRAVDEYAGYGSDERVAWRRDHWPAIARAVENLIDEKREFHRHLAILEAGTAVEEKFDEMTRIDATGYSFDYLSGFKAALDIVRGLL